MDTVDVGRIDVTTAVGTSSSGVAVAESVVEEDLWARDVRRDVDKVEFLPLVVLEGAATEVPLGKGWTDGLKTGAGEETLEMAADVPVAEPDFSVVLGCPTTDVPLKNGFGVTLPGSESKVDEPDGDTRVDSVETVVPVEAAVPVEAVVSVEAVVPVVESVADAELGMGECEAGGGSSEMTMILDAVKLKLSADDEVDNEADDEVKDKVDDKVDDEVEDEVDKVDTTAVLELLAVVEADTGCVSGKSVVDSSTVLLVLGKVVSVLESDNVDKLEFGASSPSVVFAAVVVGGAEKRPSITEGLELLFDKISRIHFVPLRGPASTVAARKQAQVIRLPAVVRISSWFRILSLVMMVQVPNEENDNRAGGKY